MLRALLAPPLCWSCRAPAACGAPLCRACRRALRFLPRAHVDLCGLAVWAPVAYEGPASDLVKGLKFHGATAVANEMAALIVAGAPDGTLGGPPRGTLAAPPAAPPALVPVPLHPGRRRSRAFNQAEAIAVAIAARTGLPLVDCLARAGLDRRQVGRGRAARLEGPAGSVSAIAAAPGEAVLVDDVVTTGATLAACAAALRRAGSRSVRAVAFARTAGR
jgi:predicted amidophosphoribosyltransferase